MPRAQFRDTALLRGGSGGLIVAPTSATVAVYDTGTSTPISELLYADSSSGTTLPNPIPMGPDGLITFWTAAERGLDVVVSATGYSSVRTTVTTDAATSGLPSGGTSGQLLT